MNIIGTCCKPKGEQQDFIGDLLENQRNTIGKPKEIKGNHKKAIGSHRMKFGRHPLEIIGKS